MVGGLKKLELDPARIKYLIVSHGHFDHSGGAKYLQDVLAQITRLINGGAVRAVISEEYPVHRQKRSRGPAMTDAWAFLAKTVAGRRQCLAMDAVTIHIEATWDRPRTVAPRRHIA